MLLEGVGVKTDGVFRLYLFCFSCVSLFYFRPKMVRDDASCVLYDERE